MISNRAASASSASMPSRMNRRRCQRTRRWGTSSSTVTTIDGDASRCSVAGTPRRRPWVTYGLAVACLVATAPRMIRSRRLDFAVVALAPLLVLGIHAFVSVSLPRYNLMLLPLLSVCMGLAATSLGVQICARVTAAGAARRRR